MVAYIWKLTIVVQPVLFVHLYIFIENGASYGKAWHSENILLNLIGSAIIFFEYEVVWIVSASVLVFTVAYVNTLSKLLKSMNW